MTYEKLQKALRELDDMLCGKFPVALKQPGGYTPYSDDDDLSFDIVNAGSHCRWMVQEALTFPPEKKEKGMRWLGFIQGVMWCAGWTVDEMKDVNMPDEEKA